MFLDISDIIEEATRPLKQEIEALQIYRGYCLYQMGAYRRTCTEENGLVPLPFTEWRKQLTEERTLP